MQKTLLSLTVALTCATGPMLAQSLSGIEERNAEIAELFSELQDPQTQNWEGTQDRIFRLWGRSGSASADLLLERGIEALETDDLITALEHLTALTDHAPDFAEGWSARATVFYLMDEYGMALVDAQQALALNPSHFGVLAGVGIMLEEMQEFELALTAYKAAIALNPHPGHVTDAIERLERRVGEVQL